MTTPYVFISYAHADSEKVLPIVAALKEAGIHVWYDGGIEAGSEWPEYIAEKVANCSKFVLFISESYLNSQNCKRELNFAISRRKDLLSIYIEDVELSLGVEMQLGTYQALFKNRFQSEEQFLARILGERFFDPCRLQEPAAPEAETKEEPLPPAEEAGVPAAPIVKDPVPEKKPAPTPPKKPKPEKIATEKKKKKGLPLVAVAGGAAVLLLVILLSLLGKVTICGEKIKRNTERISLYDTTVTQEDMEKIASLKKLEDLKLENCEVEKGAIKKLEALRGPLSELSLVSCSGMEDYSGISSAEKLESLCLQDCGLTNEQLKGIAFDRLPLLEEVDLSKNQKLSKINPLAPLSALTTLWVDDTAVQEFSALKDCQALGTFSAVNCGIEDLSTLSNKGITELKLSQNKIDDLTSLSAMEGLHTLYASGNQIADLTPLSKLIRLRDLQLSDNKITSLEALSSLSGLKYLHINRNQLKDLSGLENSLVLEELQANENKIQNINGLTNSTVLEEVRLNSNEIADLSLLEKSASTLRRVYCAKNQLKDLSFLQNATQLMYLNFDHNQVNSLKPLEQAVALRGLSGEYNALTSLEGLANAAELRDLYLAHNKIKDMKDFESLLSNAKNDFGTIDLSSNQISEPLPKSYREYALLAVYNNPLQSLEWVKTAQGSRLIFTYVDGMDPTGFNDAFYSYSVIDCPKDKQLSVEEAIHGYTREGTFCTAEEADQFLLNNKTEQIIGSN